MLFKKIMALLNARASSQALLLPDAPQEDVLHAAVEDINALTVESAMLDLELANAEATLGNLMKLLEGDCDFTSEENIESPSNE